MLPSEIKPDELYRFLQRRRQCDDYLFEHATTILEMLPKTWEKEWVMDRIQDWPVKRQQEMLVKHPSIDKLSFAILWPEDDQRATYPDEAPVVIVRNWSFAEQVKYYAKYPPNYESAMKAKYSEGMSRIRGMQQVLYMRVDELRWLCGCKAKDDLHATAALSIYCHFHGKAHDIHVPWMEKILTFTHE